jgi:hypothetical protein
MVTTRNIMRGTFRLWIALAAIAAIYGFYEHWTMFSEAQHSNLKLVTTLACGARFSEMTLKSAMNQAGLIDLGRVECAADNSGHRSANLTERVPAL